MNGVTLATARFNLALAALVVAVHGVEPGHARGQPPALAPPPVTRQDELDRLAAEADAAARAVEAETEKPLPEQREVFYRDMLARSADLLRSIDAVVGRTPRLTRQVSAAMTEARAGLERIANGGLRIGMSAEEVRAIRGEPSAVSDATTAGGVQQQWHYGPTRLSFDGGTLVAIAIVLTAE